MERGSPDGVCQDEFVHGGVCVVVLVETWVWACCGGQGVDDYGMAKGRRYEKSF